MNKRSILGYDEHVNMTYRASLPLTITPYEYKWLLSCQHLAGIFSTCAKRQYFAVILAPNKRVLGTGYNGSPSGYPHCDEIITMRRNSQRDNGVTQPVSPCPRMNIGSAAGSNYDNCISNHAEANALLWSDPYERQGATLIVNGPPCFTCTKLIISAGIKRVIGFEDPSYAQTDMVKKFFHDNGVDILLATRPRLNPRPF
jgi:dCMP deaminase